MEYRQESSLDMGRVSAAGRRRRQPSAWLPLFSLFFFFGLCGEFTVDCSLLLGHMSTLFHNAACVSDPQTRIDCTNRATSAYLRHVYLLAVICLAVTIIFLSQDPCLITCSCLFLSSLITTYPTPSSGYIHLPQNVVIALDHRGVNAC